MGSNLLCKHTAASECTVFIHEITFTYECYECNVEIKHGKQTNTEVEKRNYQNMKLDAFQNTCESFDKGVFYIIKKNGFAIFWKNVYTVVKVASGRCKSNNTEELT